MRDKKQKRKKGAQKKGGENSPISLPLDPHLLPYLDGKLCTGVSKTMIIYMLILVNKLVLKREGKLFTNASSLLGLSLSSSEISDTLQ